MTIEKGATDTDKAAHRLFDKITAYHLTAYTAGHRCRHCGAQLETMYHEERLYSVTCPVCETITLVKANNLPSAERQVGTAQQTPETWTQYAPFRQRPDGTWHKLQPFTSRSKAEAEYYIEEFKRRACNPPHEKFKIMRRTVTVTMSEWEDMV